MRLCKSCIWLLQLIASTSTNLSKSHWEKVIIPEGKFCEMSRHTDGSPGAQPPRSQLVVYGTSPEFPFPLPFILNAIDTDDVIIINDITLITLLLTILMAT